MSVDPRGRGSKVRDVGGRFALGTEELLQLKSGIVTGTAEEILEILLQRMRRTIARLVLEVMLSAGLLMESTLALDTGLFRLSFLYAVEQLGKEIQAGIYTSHLIFNQRIRLTVRLGVILRRLIGLVEYAIYHIDGRPRHPGDLFYENPTIDGTVPLSTEKFKNVVRAEIRDSESIITSSLIAQGFEVQ